MKKEENHLLKLIHKRLTGELEETENQDLDSLLKNNENNLIAEREGKIWDAVENYKKGFEPNIEEGLSRLKSKIRKDQVPVAKEVKLGRRFWLTRVAAAAILLVGSFFVWDTFNPANQFITTQENIQEVHLADNTEVMVNRGSDLEYPETFSQNKRKVNLQGEAFFNVAKNPDQPFMIQTGNIKVEVLGTSFNIRDYDNEDMTEITVRSGKVKVTTLNGEKEWILEANDQLRLDKKESTYVEESNVKLNALAWFNGKVSFQDEKMSRVKEVLEHVYNVEIEFTNSALLKCDGYNVTRDLKKAPITEVLEALRVAFNMDAVEKVNENKFLLKGGKCYPK